MLDNLTLLGMSGVGKTHLATLLNKNNNYYHYSADFRLGTEYLNQEILDNILQYTKSDPYLAKLIKDNSIKVKNNISFDNLSIVTNFLGKIGNPLLGGLALNEFKRRQALHLNAEKQAIKDINKFINIAKNKGFNKFINDAGGSLCELDDENIYQNLADNTTIIYLKTDDRIVDELIKRANANPKPMYYNNNFLDNQLAAYLKQNNLTYVAEINPDNFVKWIFPKVVSYRQPKYQKIADKYGITINARDLYNCTSSQDFLDLCH